MSNEIKDTASEQQAGADQQDMTQQTDQKAQVQDGTATGTEAGEQTEEQKAAVAAKETADEAARKAEEVRKSKAGTERGIQRKIDRLTAETKTEREARHKIEVEKARLEGELTALKATGKPGQPDPNAPPVEPDYTELESVAEIQAASRKYLKDYADWNTKQLRADFDKKIEEVRKTALPPETPEQRQFKERQTRIDTVIAQGRQEFEDFDDVTNGDNLQLTPAMTDAILDAVEPEMSHKVEHFLGQHGELADKIRTMPPARQVVEIVEVAKQLKVAAMKKTTKAPAPVATVDGKSATAPKSITDAKTSEERFAIWEREKQEARH